MAPNVPHAHALVRRAPAVADVLPGVAAFALFVVWARRSGGFFPTAWYAGGLFLAGLVVVLAISSPRGLAVATRSTLVALGALFAFTVWSYASILWAHVPGDAWEGANRSALYLLVFGLFSLWRWTPAGALGLLGAFSAAVCTLGAASLAAAARASDAAPYFSDGRFAHPIGYPNGNAALFLTGVWPALFLASRREVPVLVRAPLLAVAAVLAELALLAQSRGAGVAGAATLALAFAVLPDRLRLLAAAVPVTAVVAAAAPRLLDVAAEPDGRELAERSRDALATVSVSALAVVAAGVLLAVVDRRVRVSQRVSTWVGRAVVGAAAVATVGAVLALAVLGDPRDRVASGWDSLTTPATNFDGRVGFDRGLETNRGDLWRVALLEFRDHPVRGIGSGNFAVEYLERRRSEEETLYPHSFPLEVLAQTGLVGATLMTVFLAAALAAAVAVRRRGSGLAAGASGVALVVFGYWFVHGAIDWFWELPALAGAAVASLGLAGAIGPGNGGGRPRGARRVATWLVPAVAVLAAASFVFPWLAARETRYGIAAWRAQPASADAALDRARRLDPLSEDADVAASVIARYRGDWDAMAAAASRAIARSPRNWYAHLQLALARERQGRRRESAAELAAAAALNPYEPLLRDLRARLARGERLDHGEVARIFRERFELRTR